MSAFTHRFQLIAGKEIDDRTATGRPEAHAQRRSLLTGVSAAALVLDPAATLARWAAAFARAAKAFFLARLRAASSRRAISPRAKPAAALRWTRVFAAFALLGTAWTVTPAGAATAGPDCTDQTCSTGDVSLDTTAGGTGTTTVGISSDGSLGIGENQTYTTGTLVVGASGNSGSVTVYPGATLNDDAVIGDDGNGSFTNNGTQNVTGNLILGYQSTGAGSYTISGDAQLNVNFAQPNNDASAYPVLPFGATTPPNVNGALIVGNSGSGSFTQGTGADAPIVTVSGDLTLGAQSGSSGTGSVGTYTINSGTLTVYGSAIVGQVSQNANQFTQNGGTVNIAGGVSDPAYTSVTTWNIGSGTLVVGGESVFDSGVGTYTMTDGPSASPSVLTANFLSIGFSGVGTFNQSGGSVTTGGIDMGDCGGCNGGNAGGFYNLTGDGQLTVNGNISVGDFGHGEFVQNGDATVNTVNGTLYIGNSATATPNEANLGSYDRSGTYELDAGTLNTQFTVVGNSGTGTFIQNGGTHAVQYTLTVGAQNSQPMGYNLDPLTNFGGPAPGVYTMTGGTLTAGGDPDNNNAAIVVGDAGNGAFNQVAGSVTTGVAGSQRGDLLISAQAGSTGVYNLGDSSSQSPTLQVYGDTVIGRDAAVPGATVQIINPSFDPSQPDTPSNPGFLTVQIAPSNGTLNIAGNGTTLSVNQYTGYDSQYGGNLVVGLNGNGAVTQTDQSTVYLDHNLVLGANADSTIPYTATGSYTLNATSVGSGGYNLFVGSDLDIGGMQTDSYGSNFQTTANGGTGAFNLNSGDAYVVGNVNVGNNDGTGTLNITGGTLTVGLNENGSGMNVGFNSNYGAGGGSGTVTQTGGAVSLGNPNADNAYSVLNIGNTAWGPDTVTGSYTITGDSSSLAVYGNADVGVSPGGTGTLTIGTSGGSDSPTVSINSTGNGDGDLTIGDGGTGTLNMNSGLLHTDSSLTIGVNGLGTVNQTGGTISTGYVNMSFPAGSGVSVYNLSGGELDADYVNVGFLGSGTSSFNQSGGKVDASFGGLTVNDVSSANSADANYNLSGGELDTGYTNIAVGGGTPAVGSFTQSGGTHNVQTSVILGYNAGDYGLYTMTGGTLNTGISSTGNPDNPYNLGDVIVGYGGTGEFDQSGGTVNSQSINGVTIGWGGTGTYNLTGTGSLSVAGNLDVGVFGAGAFNQGDGTGGTTNTVSGSLLISSGYGGPASSYTLTDGTLSVAGVEAVGFGAQGAFTQTGGTNNANGGISLGTLANLGIDATQFGAGTYTLGGTGTLIVGGGGIFVGDGAGTTGVFNYNTLAGDAATLNFTGAGESLVVGNAGAGTLNIGSAANPTDLDLQASGALLDVGAQAGGVGTVNLAAGSTLEDNGAIVGDAGAGAFYSNGGTHTVGTALTAANLILGNQATGAGTYDNNGGVNTVYGELIVGAYGTGTYNLGNGHPGATLNVDYVGNQGLTGDVYVGENGTGSIDASDGAIATVQGVLALGGPSPNETGTGSLTVTGAGTKWINQSQVQIGDGGTGVVLVQQGGYFESDPGAAGTPNASPSGTSAVIGYSSGGTSCDSVTGATGCVTVDGAGSEWKNAGSLKIGGTGAFGAGPGTGLLTISNGGLVIDNADVNGTAASVGWQSGSAGFVVVESGSTWTNTGDLVVGDGGAGNVNLMGGSTVSVSGFTFVGGAGAGSLFNDGSTHTTQDLVIGQQSGSTGQYVLSDGGALTVGTVATPGFMDVGESGTGTFTQTDSTSSTTVYGALDVGRYSGASGAGTVNLEGGSLTVNGFAVVGDSGTGVFNQSGGSTVTIGSDGLAIGRGLGNLDVPPYLGTGTYNLSDDNAAPGSTTLTVTGGITLGSYDGASGAFNQTGGVVTADNEIVGVAGQGSWSQSAGANSFGASLTLGNNTGGQGSYDLSGGSLSGGAEYIGAAGTGTFTQEGGTNVGTYLSIGNNAGGSGSYAMSGGALTINGDTYLGDTQAVGAFSQTGGTANLNGDVNVGWASSTQQSTFSLGGAGALTTTGNITVGAGSGSDGAFAFNTNVGDSATLTFSTPGSQITVGDAGLGYFTQGGGDLNLAAQGVSLEIGAQAGSNGHYVLTGGALEDGALVVGDAGTGSFATSGGAQTVHGNLVVGNHATGNGTYTLSGGSLTLADSGAEFILGNAAGAHGAFNYSGGTVNFASGQNLYVGFNGTGVVHQSGGDLNLSAAGASLDIAKNAGSFGQYYLTGGTLETGSLDVGDAGIGQFNESGGAATVNGDLVAANGAGSGGTVSISGGSLTVTGNAQIGNGAYGSFTMQPGATVDIQGSMTIGTLGGATGGAGMEGGALTVGGELLINAGSSMKIEDTSGSAATVTVDGALVNNGELNLGLHDIASPSQPSTLTVSNGFTNNGGFNFEANSVLNANVTNNDYFSTQNGAGNDTTLNGNMDNHALVNVSSLGGGASSLTQTGNFTNRSGATLQVIGSGLTINGSGTALDNYGAVRVTQDVNGTTAPTSTVAITGDVKNESTGTMTFQDAKVTVNGNLDNANTLTILGHVGAIDQPSSVTVNGTTTNEATGTITVSKSVVIWNGTVTNNGAYVSDPSTQTFTGNLVNGATGYLVGGAGDTFIVEGNFLSASTQSTLWNTTQATIEFGLAGSGADHTFDVTGLDLGAGSAGFTNNFAWGDLTLDSNNTITMVGTGSGSDALYVDVLTGLIVSGGEVTNLASDGVNIYYDASLNPSLDGQNYALSGGGELIAVGGSSAAPEPSTWALMFLGFGGLGFAAYRRARAARALAV